MIKSNDLTDILGNEQPQTLIKYIKTKKLYNDVAETSILVGILYQNSTEMRHVSRALSIYLPIGTLVYNKNDNIMELYHDKYLSLHKKIDTIEGKQHVFKFEDLVQLKSHIKKCSEIIHNDFYMRVTSPWFLLFTVELYIRLYEQFGYSFTLLKFHPYKFMMVSARERYVIEVKLTGSAKKGHSLNCKITNGNNLDSDKFVYPLKNRDIENSTKDVDKIINKILIKAYTDIGSSCVG